MADTTEAVERLTELADEILEAATNVCVDPDGGPDDETGIRFTGERGCALARELHALLSERAAMLAKLETARKDRDAAEAAVEAAKAEVSEAVSRWCIRMADVREASGIGHKPMLDEVPGAIKARISEIEARAQAAETKLATLTEALKDALAGWRYIRRNHGDLYGVGWDRVEEFARAALAQTQDEKQ